MTYRVCWSLALWQSQESGCTSVPLNAYDDRQCEEIDRIYGKLVQSERDPYISQLSELGFGVKAPSKRRIAA
jgi:hypothetical protein